MATLTEFEEDTLMSHLINGGFDQAFTDVFGGQQVAPKMQVFEYEELAGKHVIFIRKSGTISNASDHYIHKRQPMLIGIAAATTDKLGAAIANGLANDIDKYIKDNIAHRCMTDIQSSGVTGPYKMPSGRRVYEINVNCLFNWPDS